MGSLMNGMALFGSVIQRMRAHESISSHFIIA